MKLFRRLLAVFLLVSVIAVIAAYVKLQPPTPPALQAFINGNVLTVNPANDKTEAVLIEGDKIVALGSTKEITALIQEHHKRKSVVVHDLAGATLMPGIIDAHSHFPGSGVYAFAADLNAEPIGHIQNIEQMLSVLKQLHAHKQDNDDWLFGFGYDDTQMQEGRHPNRDELDTISSSRPIFILHISGHIGVANSKALELLKVDEGTEAPAGGEYRKDENGRLTGLILENAIFSFMDQATDFSLSQILKIVESASFEYAAQGVTTAQNGAADWRNIFGLKWASRLGKVKQRVIVWPRHDVLNDYNLTDLKADNNSQYEIGAVKLLVDGSIQGYTGFLSQPYHVQPEMHGTDGDDSDRDDSNEVSDAKNFAGKPLLEQDALTELVTDYFAAGQQLAIHGNGDAAIDYILQAVEQAQKAHPNADPRVVLVHAQMATPEQLKKMKVLGVTPSFFSAHTYYWADRHRSIFLGPERTTHISPAKSANKIDLKFSIHLDTPVVPMQPMRLLWTAVNRESSNGQVIGRTERISRTLALRAITIDAAYQIFKEDQLGSIEVGKLADLVVMDSDPTQDNVDLLKAKVLKTFVGGVQIYSFD